MKNKSWKTASNPYFSPFQPTCHSTSFHSKLQPRFAFIDRGVFLKVVWNWSTIATSRAENNFEYFQWRFLTKVNEKHIEDSKCVKLTCECSYQNPTTEELTNTFIFKLLFCCGLFVNLVRTFCMWPRWVQRNVSI